MRRSLFIGAAALAMAATPVFAQTISFAAGSPGPAPGTTVFQNFDSLPANSSIGTNAFAFNPANSTASRPAFGSSGNFGSVLSGGTYSVSFGPTSIFSFVLGSLDTYNTLTLNFVGGGTTVLNGGAIIGGLSFLSGSQSDASANGTVTYTVTSGPLLSGAIFNSSQNSFEFDNLAVAGVPEPATWGMLILGFGLVGATMRRRRTSVRFANA